MVGSTVGEELGSKEGYTEGVAVGRVEGPKEGMQLGVTEGLAEGNEEGFLLGTNEGFVDGLTVGLDVGVNDGKEVASNVKQFVRLATVEYAIPQRNCPPGSEAAMALNGNGDR